jgi:hypothetical protein
MRAEPAPAPAAPGDALRNPDFWRVRDWLFSLSLANICFFRTWAALLERGRHIVPTAFIVAILDVLLMAICLRTGYYIVQRSRNPLLRWAGIIAFAGLVMLPFHALTTVNFAGDVQKRNITYAVALVVAGLIIVSRRFRHATQTLFVIAAPFVLVTFGQSASRISAYDAARWQPPKVPVAGEPRAPRLVWVLFDEMDYGIAFGAKRPALPELDRIVAESFHATNAHPPGATTSELVPRMITGDQGATKTNAGTLPNVFSRAKQDGIRTAVIGWFINYCGLFSSSLEACWTTAMDAERGSMGTTAAEMASNQLRNIFENQFRSPFGQPIGAQRHAIDYKFILRAATEATASPGFDFVYIHFPVPHEPFFYDSSTGRYDLGEKPITGFFIKDYTRYIDALQLVDKSLGQVRRSMEASGVWSNTHVLLTSDHTYRQRHRFDTNRNDNRVPFILRLAGSSEPVAYSERFNSIVVADLATALLRREVQTTAQVRDWIDRRR